MQLDEWSRPHGRLMIIYWARVFQSWNSNFLWERLHRKGLKNFDLWCLQIPRYFLEQSLTQPIIDFPHLSSLDFRKISSKKLISLFPWFSHLFAGIQNSQIFIDYKYDCIKERWMQQGPLWIAFDSMTLDFLEIWFLRSSFVL